MNKKRIKISRNDSYAFLIYEISHYKLFSIFLPYLACISQGSLSFVLLIIPKFVLDAIQIDLEFPIFLKKMVTLTLILAIITLVNMVLHNEILKVSQTFLYRKLNPIWEKKMISMNYETLISKEGKIKIEKARNVISSPNFGIVDYLYKKTIVFEILAGLILYSFIVGKLHISMLLLLIILFLFQLFIGLKIEKKKEFYKEDRAKVNRRLNYIAYGTKGMKEAKDIRIYSMISMLQNITNSVIRDKCKVELAVHGLQSVYMMITAGIILFRDSIAYIFLIYLYRKTNMSIGDFSMYFSAITGIGMWLTKLSNAVSEYKEVLGYIEDFYDFIKLPEEDNKEEDNEKVNKVKENEVEKYIIPEETPISFEFENVSYAYESYGEEGVKEIPVIKDFNLKVKAGEKIAIVGVNGAGKTTLIKLLCGMLSPKEGVIRMNNKDISNIKQSLYIQNFSAVFQKSKLLPISIEDNIIMDKKHTRDKKRMWNALEQAGLKERVNALPKKEHTKLVKKITDEMELSGGQEQRLLLARALYKRSSVLILDEPTAALDPIAENEIYQKYNEFTQGKTAFFVSHRLASTRFCDNIIFLENGKIAEYGTHKELMELNGKYADMFHVQKKYYAESEGSIL